jgi:alkyl sulfatase BDS1-like metallo-beta-lactamase superfamily hydrolase
LGKTVSVGTATLIAPTEGISTTGERLVIDGVDMVFLMAPNTEAPAEMLIYFPQLRVLDAAEDATHTLHNLYTLRGAVVRDAKAWWKALNEAIELWGDKTDVVIAQHHWPTWGQQNVVTFLKKQRDLYKYIHDQTLRLANQGYTMLEIGEMVTLPASIAQEWYNRGYYGSVNHDVKAVYQRYLGWYDSNPANLHPLPPVDASKKYVEYMGGPEEVLAKARQSFENGEYRWVAQVMNHVVFAFPDNVEARNLEADALEQLGYQTENATWRNEFLMGAYELRNGVFTGARAATTSSDALKALTLDQYFDFMGIRLNGPKADGKTITLNWNFTDVGEQYAVELENSVLIYTRNKQHVSADVTVTLTRATVDAISLQQTTFVEAFASGAIKVDGDKGKLLELFSLFDTFDQTFNIVTP